jgi:hypothetical protein
MDIMPVPTFLLAVFPVGDTFIYLFGAGNDPT